MCVWGGGGGRGGGRWKYKKTILICRLLKILPRVQSVNIIIIRWINLYACQVLKFIIGHGCTCEKIRFLTLWLLLLPVPIEPAHDKIYNKTCVTSKDSD